MLEHARPRLICTSSLQKDPKNRASFEELLRHQWLIPFTENKVDHREVVKSWLESLSEKA